jgi:hypothetical protein
MMFEVEVDVENNRIMFLTEPLVDVVDEDPDVGNGASSSSSSSRTNNNSSDDDGRTSTGGSISIIKYEHSFGEYLLLGLAAVSTLAIGIFFAFHPIHGHAFHPFGKSNNTYGSGGGGGGGGGGPNNHSGMTAMRMDSGNNATTARPNITTSTKIDDIITKKSF